MTAVQVPNGEQTFLALDGTPLVGGFVYMYVPGTTTPKPTWQDSAETTPNTNPIQLDPSGRAIIYGTGQYRQLVTDAAGNFIWDQLTGLGDMAGQDADNVTITGGTLDDVTITNSTITGPAIIPSGTVMVFLQSAAPTGWTQQVVANDQVLRCVNDSTGGNTGGGWGITGLSAGTTIGGTNLTADQIPQHEHHLSQNIMYQGTTIGLAAGSAYTVDATILDTGPGNGLSPTGNQHVHSANTIISQDGSWRPAYVNALVASRD